MRTVERLLAESQKYCLQEIPLVQSDRPIQTSEFCTKWFR